MPDDTPVAKAGQSIDELASKLIDDLHLKGGSEAAQEAAPQSALEQRVTALTEQLQAADNKGDAEEIRRLALEGKAAIATDRQETGKARADLLDYLNEATNEGDDIEVTKTKAQLETFDQNEQNWEEYRKGTEEFFDSWIGIADAGAAPETAEPASTEPEPTATPAVPEPEPVPAPVESAPAPLKIKPIPPKAAPAQPAPETAPEPTPETTPAAKELSDEEEEQRAAGEGMTAVQPPSVESVPAPASVPEAPAAPSVESGPATPEDRLKAAMEEIERARKEFGEQAEAMIERMKQELIEKIKAGSGIPPSTP